MSHVFSNNHWSCSEIKISIYNLMKWTIIAKTHIDLPLHDLWHKLQALSLTIRYFGCATEQFNKNSSMLVEPTYTRKYRASISHSWMWWLGMLGEPNVSRWLVYIIPLNFMSLSNAYCLAWPNSSKLLHMHINCRMYQRKLISSSIYFKFPRNLLNSRIWRSKFMRHCLLCSPLNIRD